MRLEAATRVDRWLARLAHFPIGAWLLAGALGGMGVLFVRSATQAGEFAGQDGKQAVALAAGALLATPLAFVRRSRLLAWAGSAYAVALLALCLVPIFGVTINGARRWFGFGSMTIQPTEFMKPALILALARWLRLRPRAGFGAGVGVPVLLTLIPMWFMVRQPDLGSALSLLPVLLAMCIAAGAPSSALLLLIGVGLAMLAAAFPLLHSYQQERILVWLTQDDMTSESRRGAGYHLWQSLIAVGSAGLSGSGLFQGPLNVGDFLPYRSTDFLFAVVAEETGFLGGSLLIVVYLALPLLMLRQASLLRDRFGRLLATGVAAYFATHLFVHTGVCTGLLPPTGLPLPLLSYGRSSVAGAWLCLVLYAHAVLRRERTLAGE